MRLAIETIKKNNFTGASTYLREAGKSIKAGQFAQSVVHSIHAVESIARITDPNANTFGAALRTLEKAEFIKHRTFKETFSRLYGYTSDEQGIRHALRNKRSADVDEVQFMFGACASFAAYLINQHRKMSERQGTGH